MKTNQTTINDPIRLCLGIDPNPTHSSSFADFKQCVDRHAEFLKTYGAHFKNKILKPQLAFFLAYGSKGIELLEEFIQTFRDEYTIILDGKFNEIENSLKAYLKFVFSTLKAHGLTINAFLGEKTLELSFESCAQEVGEKGRVYVLCVTSENSQNALSYLQKDWPQIVTACTQVRDQLFKNDPSYNKIAGVVVGANRESVLLSHELQQSDLSVLAPGLGAQGASWDIVQKCRNMSCEITFPISRGIFSGGNITVAKMNENYNSTDLLHYFRS